jgi:hypothetical protein
VVVGLLGLAALPAAIVVAQLTDAVELLDAAAAIPVALGGGLAAIVLSRRGRRQVERTLGRVGGERSAAAGRMLGVLALCVGTAGAIAVGVYAVLEQLA